MTAELVVGNETFNARGRTVTDEGWKKVYGADDEAVETLPSFKKGEE